MFANRPQRNFLRVLLFVFYKLKFEKENDVIIYLSL
jgi:hypothetical protein